MIPLSTCLGPAPASRADPSSVQEGSNYSANSANPRLPDLFCLRTHLWAMDSSLSCSQGFTLIDSSMSGVCSLSPTVLLKKGSLPSAACSPAFWHCPIVLVQSLGTAFWQHGGPLLTSLSSLPDPYLSLTIIFWLSFFCHLQSMMAPVTCPIPSFLNFKNHA